MKDAAPFAASVEEESSSVDQSPYGILALLLRSVFTHLVWLPIFSYDVTY